MHKLLPEIILIISHNKQSCTMIVKSTNLSQTVQNGECTGP